MSEISENVEIFQNMLIADATSGGGSSVLEYRKLREEIINHHLLKDIVPRFVRTCRSPAEFWQFIKLKYPTYAERRQFIWEEFGPMFDRLDGNAAAPSDESVSIALQRFDADTVHQLWSKALERRDSDPEGAITLARTILESVCKRILDEHGQTYRNNADLPALYSQTANLLNIAPSQHSEQIFKQILGGCSGVVEGLGALRNKLSDAHGQGSRPVRPAARHAELAVNLAGAVAIFLIATDDARSQKST